MKDSLHCSDPVRYALCATPSRERDGRPSSSLDDGELFREPIVCWAFMSERPYVENRTKRDTLRGWF